MTDAALVSALQHGVSSTSSTVLGTASKLVLDEEAAPHVALAPIPAYRAPVADDAPRIGAKGESLVRAARELPRWDAAAARACPLCTYPAQQGAAAWKAAHSVGSDAGASHDADIPSAALDLRTWLSVSYTHLRAHET